MGLNATFLKKPVFLEKGQPKVCTDPTRVEIGGSAKPNFDRLARLYRMVGGYPEVIRTQLPVIEEQ